MASVPGKNLNQENIIKKVFDETTDSLRTTSTLVVPPGGINVNLSAASGDNVAISDGTDTLLINPDGSLNVNPGNLIISHLDDSIRLGDGTNLFSSHQRETGEIGLDTNTLNRVFSKPFDELEVTSKNDDGDPLVVVSRLNASLVQTVTLVYDADGDFQKLTVS
jgi:hypothetical protein